MPSEPSLRVRLSRPPIVLAPGVYDALTALIAEQAGFGTLYVSGAAIAYSKLGRPDIGLVSMSEVVGTVALIRDRVGADLIVDADTGYGNALNVRRTVRQMERAGANAIQLEDQDFPKRCGHLDGKALVPAGRDGGQDQGGGRRAPLARDADRRAHRRGRGRGLRGARSRAPGSTARPAPTSCSWRRRERTTARAHRPVAGTKAPLLANMVEGGKTPLMSAPELQSLGFALVIFPGAIARVLAKTAGEFYAAIAAHGTSEPWRARMLDFDALNELIGTPEMLALGERYSGEPGRKRGADRKR